MPQLELTVLSLRYSSWSMRPWLALTHAGAAFTTRTVELPHMQRRAGGAVDGLAAAEQTSLAERRALGSVRGLFPVLQVDGEPIHESLAICEYAAEAFPAAGLWPADRLQRAQARAISCEMLSGFSGLRSELSCHLFGRVAGFTPGQTAQADIARVFEIWTSCLDRSGGPYLFGEFTIADAMYFPVLTRFRTYGIGLPPAVAPYAAALDAAPTVCELVRLASTEPRIPIYDDYLQSLGGNPGAALEASQA